jgi:thiosulfate reductase cytochrome b subunit
MRDIARHMRAWKPGEGEASSYNVLQRVAYSLVIFVLFPLIIWTGLDMSPAFTSVFPGAVTILGGRQAARTLHFVVTILLVLFLVVHVAMVFLAGFRERVGAMITGRLPNSEERA